MSDVADVETRITEWDEHGETVLSPSRLDVAAVRRGGFTSDGDQPSLRASITRGTVRATEGKR